ncbi:mitogen-activated protein kinase kinase kinase 5, partial [Quercus suber]|uniref:mitogen-activated protein kinase kinase kinase 5 n=1 Tax=Quercus suber TaxID=58331 RepID=UPI0032DE411F
MSVRSSLSSSSSSRPLPKERSCSVNFLFPSPKMCPRRGLEDRDRGRDRDSACSNSPIRSEFASCETRDVKKSMDYGDKSCRQEHTEKNGSESSREIPSTEMIPGFHPPAFFGYSAFSSDTSSLHSPLGAAMPLPSAPTSQPIAKSESVPAFSSDNSSLHSPLGAAMPSPSAPTPQPIAKSESVPMNNQWNKGKHIKSGAFGHVYVATNRETGALCAMKEVVLIPDDPGSAECIMQLQQPHASITP